MKAYYYKFQFVACGQALAVPGQAVNVEIGPNNRWAVKDRATGVYLGYCLVADPDMDVVFKGVISADCAHVLADKPAVFNPPPQSRQYTRYRAAWWDVLSACLLAFIVFIVLTAIFRSAFL